MNIDNWQPIETAPKDGTRIIICGVGYMKHPCIAHWNQVFGNNKKAGRYLKQEGWYNGRADYWHTSPATHWMPCPQIPTGESK